MGDGEVSHFIGQLELHELAGHGGRWFCLLSDLTFVETDAQSVEIFRWTAQAGTLTDYASVPRVLWSIFPPYGKHTRAAVIHDDMCTRRTTSSRFAHDVFRRMLKISGCSWWTQFMFHRAVMHFGPTF